MRTVNPPIFPRLRDNIIEGFLEFLNYLAAPQFNSSDLGDAKNFHYYEMRIILSELLCIQDSFLVSRFCSQLADSPLSIAKGIRISECLTDLVEGLQQTFAENMSFVLSSYRIRSTLPTV